MPLPSQCEPALSVQHKDYKATASQEILKYFMFLGVGRKSVTDPRAHRISGLSKRMERINRNVNSY